MKTFKQSTLLLMSFLLFTITSCKKTDVAPAAKNAVSTANAQAASSVYHNTQKVNDESYNWNPCTQEWVHFTGYALVNTDVVINGNNVSADLHFNEQGEKGVGLSSGIQYQGVGGQNISFSGSFTNGFYNYTSVGRITMVAPGGNNLVQSLKQHVTVNANGELTVFRDDYSLSCQ
jgi:hypothetical protein